MLNRSIENGTRFENLLDFIIRSERERVLLDLRSSKEKERGGSIKENKERQVSI